MLKLSYTDIGLLMERISTPLETLIAQRVILAMRLGQPLYIESGRASFLLPADIPELVYVETLIQQNRTGDLSLFPVDAEFVELSLCGTWVAQSSDAQEGMFLSLLSDRLEFYVVKLWQLSQAQVSLTA
jgi:hypothetical protein